MFLNKCLSTKRKTSLPLEEERKGWKLFSHSLLYKNIFTLGLQLFLFIYFLQLLTSSCLLDVNVLWLIVIFRKLLFFASLSQSSAVTPEIRLWVSFRLLIIRKYFLQRLTKKAKFLRNKFKSNCWLSTMNL